MDRSTSAGTETTPPRTAPGHRPVTPAATSAHRHRPEIDWLRVMGMAAVFVVHVALVFVPWVPWHVQSPHRTAWSGLVVVLLAPWVMPLFMFLAGQSAWYSLGRRGGAAFVRERARHVLLPLVVGILVLVPPQVYLERRLAGDFAGSFVAFYPTFFRGLYPTGNFAWHHLWFLGYLFVFSVAFLPLLRHLRGEGGRAQLARLAAVADRPGGLLLLALPLTASRVLLSESVAALGGTPADWHNRTLLPAAFLAGYVMSADGRFTLAAIRQRHTNLIVAAFATIPLLGLVATGDPVGSLPPPGTASSVALWGAYALAGWCWVLVLLARGRRRPAHRDRIVTVASAGVFPFYLVHQPAIVLVAFLAIGWGLPMPVDATVVLVGGLALSVALTAALQRRWAPGRRVVGASDAERAAVADDAAADAADAAARVSRRPPDPSV